MTMGHRPTRSLTALFAARSKPVTNSGRGWVRTSDLSRVKGDKEADKSQETPGKKEDPGEGG
jgi:hypothetical protein